MGEVSPSSEHRRRTVVAIGAGLVAYALVWIVLPSNDVHPDALDELLMLERGGLPVVARHPADGPILNALMRGLRFLGYEGRAIRPVQLWNGVWMTVALAGVLGFARRSRASWVAAIGIAAILAGMYASIHLAVDPFLAYYPPGLALVTWALTLSLDRSGGRAPSDHRGEWLAVMACLVGAVLFNPMVVIGCPIAAVLWYRRARRSGRSSATALLRGLALLVIPFAAMYTCMPEPVGGLRAGPYGGWASSTWPAVVFASNAAVLVPGHGASTLLLRASSLGLPLALLAGTALVSLSWSAALRFLPFAVAAACGAAFVAWWDPGQIEFWLLPAWMAGLGAIHALPDRATVEPRRSIRVLASLASAVLLLEAGLLWASNGRLYVCKAAMGPSAREQEVLRIARQLTRDDLLVFLGWGDPALPYYSDLRHDSLLSLHRRRGTEQSTMQLLRQRLLETRKRGGAVYLEVPPAGQGWIDPLCAKLPERDFDEGDFERLALGSARIEFGDKVFQEVLGFRRHR